jgi:exosortase E/protease (VPEID-CTERM system)
LLELHPHPVPPEGAIPYGAAPALSERRTLWRCGGLGLLFALELTSLSVWLDGNSLTASTGAARLVHDWGAWILRVVVGFCVLFGTCIWLRNRPGVEEVEAGLRLRPLNRTLLASHALALTAFALLSSIAFRISTGGGPSGLLLGSWLFAGIAAIVFAALAFLPASAWMRLTGGTGALWIYTFAAVIAACVAGNASRSLWVPVSHVTFGLVRLMLTPFFSSIVADPSGMILGTRRFVVEIAPECSGFEGMGLIAAFGTLWLFLFRKECRFPHALVLIPAGVIMIFLLNAARIAALIAIGDHGAERIALGGFHSQAGWIAFNAIALGLTTVAGSIPWIRNQNVPGPRPRVPGAVATDNPTAAWVLPFVVILGTGMLSHAMSADFEWLYPLRFFAAAFTLWSFRHKYRSLDWRVGWAGPVAGLVVFLLWIFMERSGGRADAMPAALAAAQPWTRIAWICVRTLAATVTVPIAEELAFRGFLLRRVLSEDFEQVSFRRFSWPAIAISSILFGLLHGDRWLAGAAAGVVYALVLARRGRIGEAVAAHSTTNILIAADVLLFHQWQLW